MAGVDRRRPAEPADRTADLEKPAEGYDSGRRIGRVGGGVRCPKATYPATRYGPEKNDRIRTGYRRDRNRPGRTPERGRRLYGSASFDRHICNLPEKHFQPDLSYARLSVIARYHSKACALSSEPTLRSYLDIMLSSYSLRYSSDIAGNPVLTDTRFFRGGLTALLRCHV